MQSMPLSLIAGLSVLFATGATLIFAIAGAVVDGRSSWRFLPVVFACLFFVALTQLPLPEPGLLRIQ
jgi:hypothetical protein